jgi:hypothetical protein
MSNGAKKYPMFPEEHFLGQLRTLDKEFDFLELSIISKEIV